jgi:hypothetical protein
MYTLSYGQAVHIAVTDHGAYKGIARAGSLGRPVIEWRRIKR